MKFVQFQDVPGNGATSTTPGGPTTPYEPVERAVGTIVVLLDQLELLGDQSELLLSDAFAGTGGPDVEL